MKAINTRLTRLEKQLKYRLEPLQVNLVHFGDGPLPENPRVHNGVKVQYVRYLEQTMTDKPLQSRQEFAKECDNGTPEGRMAALILGAD
jgi:hypothetical protein